MRKGLASMVTLLVAASATFSTAAPSAGGTNSSSVKIPLPAPNEAQVSLVTVLAAPKTTAASLKVVATNAAALGGPQLNSQVVAAVAPAKSTKAQAGTFGVWVFIHSYPPVHATRMVSTAQGSEVDLSFTGAGIKAEVNRLSCHQLEGLALGPPFSTEYAPNYLTDNFVGKSYGITLLNLVPTNDTAAEEQLDEAVSTQCPGAEKPDAGSA